MRVQITARVLSQPTFTDADNKKGVTLYFMVGFFREKAEMTLLVNLL